VEKRVRKLNFGSLPINLQNESKENNCSKIECDILEFDFQKYMINKDFSVVVLDPPWTLSPNNTRGVSLLIFNLISKILKSKIVIFVRLNYNIMYYQILKFKKLMFNYYQQKD
jgi:16S rRNA G966 N2-methylase RsmD